MKKNFFQNMTVEFIPLDIQPWFQAGVLVMQQYHVFMTQEKSSVLHCIPNNINPYNSANKIFNAKKPFHLPDFFQNPQHDLMKWPLKYPIETKALPNLSITLS